jgi:hypothetical protein
MQAWTAPGRCFVAWDGQAGPYYDTAAREKAHGSYNVYRGLSPYLDACVLIGQTRAEGFLDCAAFDTCVAYYIVTEQATGETVGSVDVQMPRTTGERAAPDGVSDANARPSGAGTHVSWVASGVAEREILCYLVWDSNQSEPDSVVWPAPDRGDVNFVDYTHLARGTKPYDIRALDTQLRLSELVEATYHQGGGYVGRWNLIHNPRVHDTLVYDDSNWYVRNDDETTRETSAPGSPPDGADAFIKAVPTIFIPGASANHPTPYAVTDEFKETWRLDPDGSAQVGYLLWSFWAYSDDAKWQVQSVVWNNSGGVHSIQEEWVPLSDDSTWHRYDLAMPLYEDFVALRFALTAARYVVPTGTAYLTLAHVEPSLTDAPLSYSDGDITGWSWEKTEYTDDDPPIVEAAPGDPHGSMSVLRSSRWNSVWNPAAADLSEWQDDSSPSLARVAVISGVSLPAGAAACFGCGPEANGAALQSILRPLPPGVLPGDTLEWQVQLYVGGSVTNDDCSLDVEIGCFDLDGTLIEWAWVVNPDPPGTIEVPLPLVNFALLSGSIIVPVGTFLLKFYVTCNELVSGGADAAVIYMTQVMLAGEGVGSYGDGDTAGWVWANGDCHGPSCANEGTL